MTEHLVSVFVNKYDYADAYQFAAMLFTPEADRLPRATFVTSVGDFLINSGPAENNGFTVDYKPGATSYEYMVHQEGSFALTRKFTTAAKQLPAASTSQLGSGVQAGASFIVPVPNVNSVSNVTKELLDKNLLKPSDVIGLASFFSCTVNR